MSRSIYILGTRGIPARHGGFETFAERLSLYLSSKGWSVTVYCQEEGSEGDWESNWNGIRLIHISVKDTGTLGTISFDWKSILHALTQRGVFLTLGYNTAILNLLQRLKGQTNLINMDGIEWKRDKWGFLAKSWFWINERAGCWIGNHLIADHPMIKEHLGVRVSPQKITMIPYGADNIESADLNELSQYGVTKFNYSIVIARPEPENSILEIIRSFSRTPRNHKLLVLGNFTPDKNPYHKSVLNAASNEVIFPGAIYNKEKIQALRFFCKFYIHGHTVGGTNPSLVEALGASCAVIAHDNKFNRWVAGPNAIYLEDENSCASVFNSLIADKNIFLSMKEASHKRYLEQFTWDSILQKYEDLLISWYPETETATVDSTFPNP